MRFVSRSMGTLLCTTDGVHGTSLRIFSAKMVSRITLSFFQETCRQLEDKFFREKLEKLRVATNAEGRDWLTRLMPELEKWTRAHDLGGWRYEFQCSNMAESFNKLLLGIHGMPVTAIVSFTFYKLVAWFNDRHAHAVGLWSDGERWAPKPKAFLEKAKERAATHTVDCFDFQSETYEV
jgi:hypothetical protein